MIIPAVSDVAFNISGFCVYWYGVIMAFAIFAAIVAADKFFNVLNKNLPHGVILEFAPAIIICGILGARIYFCCLNPEYYFLHPLEILDIREGGLSVHGGLIGGILSTLFIIKKYKIPFLTIADCMAPATILGQAIGRWGNYFNSEAYGLPVKSQNWGLYIPPQHRIAEFMNFDLYHPAFLYESILDLTAFLLLVFILFKFGKKYAGVTFFAYLTVYSVIRFFTEQIRVDSALNIGSCPIAIIVSVLLFTAGVCGIIYSLIKSK